MARIKPGIPGDQGNSKWPCGPTGAASSGFGKDTGREVVGVEGSGRRRRWRPSSLQPPPPGGRGSKGKVTGGNRRSPTKPAVCRLRGQGGRWSESQARPGEALFASFPAGVSTLSHPTRPPGTLAHEHTLCVAGPASRTPLPSLATSQSANPQGGTSSAALLRGDTGPPVKMPHTCHVLLRGRSGGSLPASDITRWPARRCLGTPHTGSVSPGTAA